MDLILAAVKDPMAPALVEKPEDFVVLASHLALRVRDYADQARAYFHEVVLAGHACPRCDVHALQMARDGACSCRACGYECDPTIAFQDCGDCGGGLRVHIRGYVCADCGTAAVSRFLFSGLAFDTEYFRQKMAEHRERRQEQRERVSQMLANSRSAVMCPPAAIWEDVRDLVAALDDLTSGLPEPTKIQLRERFDLCRYEAHVRAHTGPIAVHLDEIPSLGNDTRLDRIWRFVAVIFLAHAGEVEVWHDGPDIRVMKRETDRKGQELSGDLEEADGIERPVGRVEA